MHHATNTVCSLTLQSSFAEMDRYCFKAKNTKEKILSLRNNTYWHYPLPLDLYALHGQSDQNLTTVISSNRWKHNNKRKNLPAIPFSLLSSLLALAIYQGDASFSEKKSYILGEKTQLFTKENQQNLYTSWSILFGHLVFIHQQFGLRNKNTPFAA